MFANESTAFSKKCEGNMLALKRAMKRFSRNWSESNIMRCITKAIKSESLFDMYAPSPAQSMGLILPSHPLGVFSLILGYGLYLKMAVKCIDPGVSLPRFEVRPHEVTGC